MQNSISASAQRILSQYANYAEKQLLSRGEISSCFVSVLSRQNRYAKFSVGYRIVTIIVAVAFITLLTYRWGVDSDTTLLICFSPVYLSGLWTSTSQSKYIWQAIAKLETIAELWREHELKVESSIHDGESLTRNPASLVAS